jgi:membrane protein DedA with SNARE-associated domain
MNLLGQLGVYAEQLVAHLGYAGISIGLVLNSFGFLIPSEVVIPLATVLAKQGHFNFVAVYVVAVVSQVIGGLIGYAIGASGGLYLVHRYGKYVLITPEDFDHAQKWYDRYGQWFAVTASCLPVIRSHVGLVSGTVGMPIWKFTLSFLVGAMIWTAIFMFLGFQLANNLGLIETYLKPISALVVLAIAAAIAYYVLRHIKRIRKK